MQQIFVNCEANEGFFSISGEDAYHLIKVVRIKTGEKIRVTTADASNFLCEVSEILEQTLTVKIIDEVASTELSNKIYLFQALPKGDRMETIIEKCVELGVYEIIPVEMKNCIVKLDAKKKKTKVERYNAIATAAAKQCKRSFVPSVHEVLSFKEAVEYASKCDVRIFPYESKNGMEDTFLLLNSIKMNDTISVFIGPEGGFDDSEVEMIKDDMHIISLGKRILRTDTAAICSLSMLMLKSEEFE